MKKKFNKGTGGNGGNDFAKKIMLWLGIALLILFVYDGYVGAHMAGNKVAFSEFLSRVESGQVTDVTIRGGQIDGKFSDGTRFTTLAPNYPNLVDKLTAQNVKIEVAPLESSSGAFMNFFLSWLPLLIILGGWFYLIRQMQGGSGKAMGFGKSKAKMISEKNNNITFAAVVAVVEAKEK